MIKLRKRVTLAPLQMMTLTKTVIVTLMLIRSRERNKTKSIDIIKEVEADHYLVLALAQILTQIRKMKKVRAATHLLNQNNSIKSKGSMNSLALPCPNSIS